MTRPAAALVAAFLALCVALPFGASSALFAQDEKKPGKKPLPEKMDKDEKDAAKKEKVEAKKDGDDAKTEGKAREPADEKQKKQFDKIRKDVEKKFKKGKKEQVWVYATHEESVERIEPTETPQPPPGPPQQGKGGMNKFDKSGRYPGTGAGAGNRQQGGATGRGAGGWETVVKNTAYMTKDPDEATEKVYAFLVEALPAASKKKDKADADEPPPPKHTLLEVKVFPTTKDGEKAAEAYHEQLEKKFQKEQQQQDWKKQARKKGG